MLMKQVLNANCSTDTPVALQRCYELRGVAMAAAAAATAL